MHDEKRKRTEGTDLTHKSLFSFLFFSVEPRVRIIINIIYNYYYYI